MPSAIQDLNDMQDDIDVLSRWFRGKIDLEDDQIVGIAEDILFVAKKHNGKLNSTWFE